MRALPLLVLALLLCLGAANIAVARDVARGRGRRALDRAGRRCRRRRDRAGHAGRERVGLKRGDVLLAIDNEPVVQVEDVVEALHGARRGDDAALHVLRLGAASQPVDVRLAPIPGGPGVLYFVLAAVGTFTLLVGGAVRLRRPRDPATLHFFWIAVAFFGVFTFSFSGRLDRLDWVFYWADAMAILALPPLFLHFTLVFPERPRRWSGGSFGRAVIVAAYMPAVVLGLARVFAIGRGRNDAARLIRVLGDVDRIELLYLAVCASSAASPVCGAPCRRSPRSPRDGSCAGSPGAPRSGRRRSRSATRCRTRSASIRRCRWSCRRSRSA